MLNLIYFTADGRFNKEACAVINNLARQGKLKDNFMTDTLFKDVEISTYEETDDEAIVSIGGREYARDTLRCLDDEMRDIIGLKKDADWNTFAKEFQRRYQDPYANNPFYKLCKSSAPVFFTTDAGGIYVRTDEHTVCLFESGDSWKFAECKSVDDDPNGSIAMMPTRVALDFLLQKRKINGHPSAKFLAIAFNMMQAGLIKRVIIDDEETEIRTISLDNKLFTNAPYEVNGIWFKADFVDVNMDFRMELLPEDAKKVKAEFKRQKLWLRQSNFDDAILLFTGDNSGIDLTGLDDEGVHYAECWNHRRGDTWQKVKLEDVLPD